MSLYKSIYQGMSLDTILAAKVQIKFVFLSSRQKKVGKRLEDKRRWLGDSVPKAEMIENGVVRFKTQTYIAQGAAACNLAEQQMQQLVIAGQVLRMPVPMILGNKFKSKNQRPL